MGESCPLAGRKASCGHSDATGIPCTRVRRPAGRTLVSWQPPRSRHSLVVRAGRVRVWAAPVTLPQCHCAGSTVVSWRQALTAVCRARARRRAVTDFGRDQRSLDVLSRRTTTWARAENPRARQRRPRCAATDATGGRQDSLRPWSAAGRRRVGVARTGVCIRFSCRVHGPRVPGARWPGRGGKSSRGPTGRGVSVVTVHCFVLWSVKLWLYSVRVVLLRVVAACRLAHGRERNNSLLGPAWDSGRLGPWVSQHFFHGLFMYAADKVILTVHASPCTGAPVLLVTVHRNPTVCIADAAGGYVLRMYGLFGFVP